MKKVITLLFLVVAVCFNIQAVDVCVTMNTVSPIMELRLKGETELIEVGDPESRKYNFSANVGTYELTAYSSDDKSVCNGTIDIVITEEDNQIFSIYTITTYATNSGWEYDTDYSINCEVSTREGNNLNFTIGDSSTAGRKTFLVLGGNSYYIELLPSSKRKEEGYSKFIKTGTIMSNVNVFGAIPLGKLYVFTTPDSASLYLGIKKANYIDFINVEKENIKTENGKTKHYYWLSTGQVYNYRVSQKDKLTHGGYFTLNATTPELEITEEDMDLFSPKTVLHDVKSNNGYNVGNILLNINEKGYLKLSKDETYSLIAYRDWQLTDNTFNNYYIDPDYHYNVTDLNGVTDSSVITIDEKGIIKAVGKGSAIVTVTYDAISLSYYTTTHAKADYLGGPFWGAIWPENTGAFIVSVDEKASEIVSNMNINNSLNLISNKLSGDKIDAEHDVLYYLENEEGYYYTFTPENVATVSVAYPEFGENTATYKGFENSDVKLDEDGSYTVKLKFGRNIIKLTDNNDGSDYQILTAKPIKYSIENGTNPGEPFQPGDQINVQFEGLYHPANKMAGIYNMNAVIKYNDIPVGSDINSSTANQYQFGSTETAQLYKVTIPEDWNTDSKYLISGGAISMSGFGDAYGSHRLVSPTTGR